MSIDNISPDILKNPLEAIKDSRSVFLKKEISDMDSSLSEKTLEIITETLENFQDKINEDSDYKEVLLKEIVSFVKEESSKTETMEEVREALENFIKTKMAKAV